MNKWLLLIAGGGIGTLLRFLLSTWASRQMGNTFPYGTLAVNLIGCLIIGMLAGWNSGHAFHENLHLLLFVGLMGGFTTFSSFSIETLQLIRSGSFLTAVAYISASNIGGVLLAAGGYKLTV